MNTTNLFRLLTFSFGLLALPLISGCNGYSNNPVADYSAYGAATSPADTLTPPDPDMSDPVDCNNMFTIATSTDQSPLVFRENQMSSYKITITSLYDTAFKIIPHNLPCANCFKSESKSGKTTIYSLAWNPNKLPPQQVTRQTLSLEYSSERATKRCISNPQRQIEIQIEGPGAKDIPSTPTLVEPSPNPPQPTTKPATAAAAVPAPPQTAPTIDKPTLTFVLSRFPQKPLILGKDPSFEFEVLASHAAFTKDVQPRLMWSAPTTKKLFDASAAVTCLPAEKNNEKSKTRFIGNGQWQITCAVTLRKVKGIVAAADKLKTSEVLELGFTGKVSSMPMRPGSAGQVSEDVSSPMFSVTPAPSKDKAQERKLP